MGNGIELAKAYVQIVPSAEGIQGKITEVLGGESSKAGDAAGQLLGKKLVGAVAKVISAAGIGKILAESIASGGALQQSLGGVETLFKDSADKVKSYAAQAYKTVGLSANAYMEQTTSFAASLLASVSHDTNAATELANMAMVDMADNANKMGTDMQDIQNAYQGFAKQNYTMLDNLKLGYGGTQAEMQRLLQDAEKISGVHYDLGNLADMYSAIHVIQQEMDITGTTAKEATTTLTGSFSAMSAAFQNVLSSLSTGADLSAPLAALVETSKTYLVDNLLPMVGNVLAGIPEVVYSLVPQLLQSGTELVNSLASGFDEGIPEFFSNALPQLLVFTEQLRANAGSFVDAGLNLITQLLNGLIAGLPQLIAYAPDIIINLAGIINDNMPKILAEGISIVVQLAAGIVQAFPSLLANWKKIFQAVLSVISAVNWLNIGKNILTGVASGVRSMGSSMLAAFKGGFSSALAWIKSLPSQAVQWGKNLIQSFINGLTGKGKVADIATAATAGFTIADVASRDELADWTSANTSLADSAQTVADIAIPAYTKSGNAAAAAGKAAGTAAKTAASVVNSYSDTVTEVLGNITRTTQTTNEVLSNGQKQQKQTITETSRQLVNGVLKDIKTVTSIAADGKKTVQQTMDTVREMANSVTSTFDTVVNGIATSTKTIKETLTDGTETTKKVITETFNEVVDGALVVVERVKNVAADGTEQVAETIKKASADSFSGLVKGWQDEADKGVLGTFGTLYKAVKSQDWLSVGQWVLSTLYNGLAPETKLLIDDFGKNLIQQVNGFLGEGISQLANGAWDLGTQIFDGLTGGFGDVVSQFSGLGSTLLDIFGGLQGPLSAAALAISKGLQGGLISAFPEILASLGGLIGAIGGAFVAMLQSIGMALFPTGFGTPQALLMIAAGVALAAVIAGIVASLGGAFKKKSTPGTGSSSSSAAGSTITEASSSLWDYEKKAPLPQRTQRPNIEVNQYIYSKAQTAADLMREAQYEQERAVLQGV
ncbi:phage tail protein [Faecalibacterium sp.]|uniref:phage tail protein n=1 Tax=Faecalibacterium sp. TaxID=1971605 RepID=UPI003A8E8300